LTSFVPDDFILVHIKWKTPNFDEMLFLILNFLLNKFP